MSPSGRWSTRTRAASCASPGAGNWCSGCITRNDGRSRFRTWRSCSRSTPEILVTKRRTSCRFTTPAGTTTRRRSSMLREGPSRSQALEWRFDQDACTPGRAVRLPCPRDQALRRVDPARSTHPRQSGDRRTHTVLRLRRGEQELPRARQGRQGRRQRLGGGCLVGSPATQPTDCRHDAHQCDLGTLGPRRLRQALRSRRGKDRTRRTADPQGHRGGLRSAQQTEVGDPALPRRAGATAQ